MADRLTLRALVILLEELGIELAPVFEAAEHQYALAVVR
jgi:hypothetical protein